MPCGIYPVHRIALAIGIRINSSLAKRAPTVGAVKTHQNRVKRPVAITQQVIPGERVKAFAIKAEQLWGISFLQMMAIGCVGHCMSLVVVHYVQGGPIFITRYEQGMRRAVLEYLIAHYSFFKFEDLEPNVISVFS